MKTIRKSPEPVVKPVRPIEKLIASSRTGLLIEGRPGVYGGTVVIDFVSPAPALYQAAGLSSGRSLFTSEMRAFAKGLLELCDQVDGR
jgi:hypothetical protein